MAKNEVEQKKIDQNELKKENNKDSLQNKETNFHDDKKGKDSVKKNNPKTTKNALKSSTKAEEKKSKDEIITSSSKSNKAVSNKSKTKSTVEKSSTTKNKVKTSTTKNEKSKKVPVKTFTKSELEAQIKALSSKKKQKIIESYDHSQPQITSKSSWDYRKLRSRTLRAMKKKEKSAIENQKNPVVKELHQKIYNQKWKKYIQPNSDENVIDMREICKYFINGTNVEYILKKLNITIKKGEIYVILGASGSGKTTLLNIISGLIDASSGDVIVQDKNLFIMNEKNKIKFRADNVSFVFQSYNLIPSLTVEENIKVGASLRSKNTEKVSVKEIMKLLQLYEQRNKYPFQLSGGQNQRVSIGRALSKNPKILFADEPTGALDEERGKEALQFLVDINEKYGTTIIMVTHNPNFKWVGDTTLKIHDGEIETLSHNKNRIKPKDIKWT